MILLNYLVVFIFGTIIGSFLNVVIDRLPQKESLIKRRSHCEHCRRNLEWYDLIPIVSYLLLRGRCRYCKKTISKYYILVEFLTGCVFVLVTYLLVGQDIARFADVRYLLAIGYYLFILSALISIFFIDLKYGIIPFRIVFTTLLVALAWYIIFPFLQLAPVDIGYLMEDNNYFLPSVLSAVGIFGFFLMLFLITRGRGLGFGDVVYVFLMGFLLGFPRIVLGIYIAFLTGAFCSIILVMLRKKSIKGGTIPFGPFLTLGTAISLLWGHMLIDKIMLYLVAR